jgi:5'-nucleotidase/UDP-sugar diphosphatase
MAASSRAGRATNMMPIDPHGKRPFTFVSKNTPSRRDVLAGSAAAGAVVLLRGDPAAAADGKKTFTILHTNDLHSNFIGMGPSSDYAPDQLNEDKTRGGFARLTTLITERKAARANQGPVLVLDCGDYSNGTAFGAIMRETGAELELLSWMGYDATTFGNHEFDFGPDGLSKSIDAAAKAGRVPPVLASNTNFSKEDASLADLQRLATNGVVRRYLVIERGGIRFGLFGVIGKEAAAVAVGAGAVTFRDPIEAATEVVTVLRETEKVDVVIALSHGGVMKGMDGTFTGGEDVGLPKAVPGIDVVIGGHSHTALQEAIIVNGRTPVVQTGKYGENLGELVLTLDGGKLTVESYQLHPIDATILGDRAISEAIDKLKTTVTEVVFASRGYSVDQPLAMVTRDIPNTFTDITASTILANLCTDAFRSATKADIAFTAAAMMRAGLTHGKSGVQTVYDVFAVAPLGAGIVDSTAGSALVTAYFKGLELKSLLEFFLVDNPTHPGEMFPRVSGMRFRYDMSRPQFDVVMAVEIGDIDRGYRPIDVSEKDERLYSLTCPLMLGSFLVGIPKYTKGTLPLVPKNRDGQALISRIDALEVPLNSTPDLLLPEGTIDKSCIATGAGKDAAMEIKEWQAIMDHLRSLPVKSPGQLPTIPVDERAAEVRALKVG